MIGRLPEMFKKIEEEAVYMLVEGVCGGASQRRFNPLCPSPLW